MKILYASSTQRSLRSPKHGAERQLMGQARAVDELDKDVEVTIDNIKWNSPDPNEFDIIHMVNSNGPNGPHQALANHAREVGVPVVATPTFWPPDEIAENGGERQEQMIDLHTQTLMPWLQSSSHLTPNSESEAHHLKDSLDTFDYSVVENAVDIKEIEQIEQNQQSSPEDWGEYVLCVGRIEQRKNQWRLMYAMQGLWQEGIDAKLVMLGKANKKYLQKISSEIERHKDRVVLDPQIKKPATVLNAIKHARVLAMPSMLETPGLVALEGAALGTPLAITEKGSTQEYFKADANYCDPMRVDSIAEAVKDAWNEEENNCSERIKENYNYKNAGKKLLSLYNNLS